MRTYCLYCDKEVEFSKSYQGITCCFFVIMWLNVLLRYLNTKNCIEVIGNVIKNDFCLRMNL